MSRYIISHSASRALNAIANDYLTKNLERGEKIFQDFNKKCQNLARFPKLGQSYDYIKPYIKPSLRGLPLNGYIIFYRVVDDVIEILRVVSGRQDLDSIFSDTNDN